MKTLKKRRKYQWINKTKISNEDLKCFEDEEEEIMRSF